MSGFRNLVTVAVVYVGLAAAVVGLVATMRPISALGLSTRSRGVLVLVAGVALVGLGWSIPATEVHVASPRTRLDEFAPAYQFNEVHTVRIAAPPDLVYRALREVTASEITFFRVLTWIRRGGRRGPEDILNAPERVPILDVATRTTFVLLADEARREVVVGTVVLAPPTWRRSEAATPDTFKSLGGAGFAKAVMNFRVEAAGQGASVLTTETRVFATDAASRRRFAAYWRMIYPGSAIIRRSWLRAIRRRAERAP